MIFLSLKNARRFYCMSWQSCLLHRKIEKNQSKCVGAMAAAASWTPIESERVSVYAMWWRSVCVFGMSRLENQWHGLWEKSSDFRIAFSPRWKWTRRKRRRREKQASAARNTKRKTKIIWKIQFFNEKSSYRLAASAFNICAMKFTYRYRSLFLCDAMAKRPTLQNTETGLTNKQTKMKGKKPRNKLSSNFKPNTSAVRVVGI